MRPEKPRELFNIYKKKSSDGTPPVWYARFWDDTEGRYFATRSTGILAEGKRERRTEAERIAREMAGTIKPKAKKSQEPSELLFDYLERFWKEDSPYFTERLILRKKKTSSYYIDMSHDDVRRHIRPCPHLQGVTLEKLKAGDVLAWQLWAIEKHGMAARRCNAVLQTMRVPVRDALRREIISKDPFRQVLQLPVDSPEKSIIMPDTIRAIIKLKGKVDPRFRALVLLACGCALRRGEIRGLKWESIDFEAGTLRVENNLVPGDPIKQPKYGSFRTVGMPEYVLDVLDELKEFRPAGTGVFVLWDSEKPGEPIPVSSCRYGTRQVLALAGIPIEKQKEIGCTLHSGRHSFITLGRQAGLSDSEVQALAGHHGDAIMNRYTHTSQVIDFAAASKKLNGMANVKKSAK